MKKIQFRVLVAAAVCSLSSCVGDPFYGYGGYAPGLPPLPGLAYGPPPPAWGYGGGRPPSLGYGPRPASRLSTGPIRGADFRAPDLRLAPDSRLLLLR